MLRGGPGKFDVLVLGGGIAGLTAAHEAARAGLAAGLIESALFGGQVANVGAIQGYPMPAPASGTELASVLVEASRDLGVAILQERASELTVDGAIKSVRTDKGVHRADRLIVATGGRLRRLGVPGEAELTGRGVSQCAFCDAGFFRDADVVVVGGGDAALQEALHLAGYCRSVTLIHRGRQLRARRGYVLAAADNPKFSFRWQTVVTAVLGDDGVSSVCLRNIANHLTDELACAGVFVFVGVEPNTALVPGAVARDAKGYLTVDAGLRTSVPGVFAVGAVRAGFAGQLANAVSDGAIAALSAANISA